MFTQDIEDLLDSDESNEIKLNFGKHKGRTLEEIYKDDKQYFMWLRNNDNTDEKLKKACESILLEESINEAKERQN